MTEHKRAPNSGAILSFNGEDQIRRLLESTGRRPAPPTEDLKTIRAAARLSWRQLVSAEQRQRRRLGRSLALAATLLVAVGVAWWWVTSRAPSTPEVVATLELLKGEIRAVGRADPGAEAVLELAAGGGLPAGSTLETAPAEGGSPAQAALRLVGGQSLRLDSGTRIQLVSTSRLVLEQGTLYLDSSPAAGQSGSVEVVTDLGVVRDIGTQFEVRLGNGDDPALRVRVREGAVRLNDGSHSYSATSGEELTLHRDGSVARGTVALYGAEWEWVLAAAPGLDIEGLALGSFLDWVSRETGWRIGYADEGLAESAAAIRLHGTIQGLTPTEAVGAVLEGSGLDYRIEDGTLLITRGSVVTAVG